MTVTLRVRTLEDAAFLRDLFASTREAELAALPPEIAKPFIDQQFTAQDAQYRAAYPDAADRIICRGETPIGRLLIHRTVDHIRLIDVAIIPAERGHGVGTELIGELCAEADQADLPVHLSVAHGNPAENLYARNKFVTTSRQGVYSSMVRLPGGRG